MDKYKLSLPALQTRLDNLREAQSLTIASADIERLFGFNDVAHARIRRFAQGHHCIVTHSDGCSVFLKES